MATELTGDDLLWNWARWTWAGEAVGNMSLLMCDSDEPPVPINIDFARQVEDMWRSLPWHERMVIIAEYPKKNVMFADLDSRARSDAARRWIAKATGEHLTDTEYRLYLGLFKDRVRREVR